MTIGIASMTGLMPTQVGGCGHGGDPILPKPPGDGPEPPKPPSGRPPIGSPFDPLAEIRQALDELLVRLKYFAGPEIPSFKPSVLPVPQPTTPGVHLDHSVPTATIGEQVGMHSDHRIEEPAPGMIRPIKVTAVHGATTDAQEAVDAARALSAQTGRTFAVLDRRDWPTRGDHYEIVELDRELTGVGNNVLNGGVNFGILASISGDQATFIADPFGPRRDVPLPGVGPQQ